MYTLYRIDGFRDEPLWSLDDMGRTVSGQYPHGISAHLFTADMISNHDISFIEWRVNDERYVIRRTAQ